MTRNERMVRELRAEPALRAFESILSAAGKWRFLSAMVAIAVAVLMSFGARADSPVAVIGSAQATATTLDVFGANLNAGTPRLTLGATDRVTTFVYILDAGQVKIVPGASFFQVAVYCP